MRPRKHDAEMEPIRLFTQEDSALSNEDSELEDEGLEPASFDDAVRAIGDESIDPFVLTGFNDISRKQVHLLREAWRELGEDARIAIADHVSMLGDDDVRLDFMRFFRTILDDRSERVRAVAAASLEPYDDPDLIAPLMTLASNDESTPVRIAALGTLQSFSMLAEFEMLEPRYVRALRSGLAVIYRNPEEHAEMRAAALSAASVDTSTDGLVEVVESFLSDDDPDLHIAAIRAMGHAPYPDWLPVLERALTNGDSDEREAAASSLGHFEDEGVVPMLLAAARDDVELPVRAAAIEALGVKGGESALHALNSLREFVGDDELELVDEAIAEAEEFESLGDDTLGSEFYDDDDDDDVE